MQMRIKQSGLILALLLTWGASHAGELCDAQCELTIDFPGGGHIAAIEALTITFGDGGLVDTGGSVTAYLENETLSLAAGESLEFEAGGRFDIGAAGNISFLDIEIMTDGNVVAAGVGGSESVRVPAGHRLAFRGAGSVTFQTNAFSEGTLDLEIMNLHIIVPVPPAGLPPPGGGPGGGSLMIDAGILSTPTNSLTLVSSPTPTIISGGTLDFEPGTLVLDPGSLNAVLGDPLVLDSITFDPVMPPTAVNVGLLTLDSEDENNAAAIDPAWLLLLTLAGLGRARPRSRVTRGNRQDSTTGLR